jgi:hypothetical protein
MDLDILLLLLTFFSGYLTLFDENKSDVFACFRDFHKRVQTQYGTIMKMLRSDNGIEYTNNIFREYL